jgi:hypothetical protein
VNIWLYILIIWWYTSVLIYVSLQCSVSVSTLAKAANFIYCNLVWKTSKYVKFLEISLVCTSYIQQVARIGPVTRSIGVSTTKRQLFCFNSKKVPTKIENSRKIKTFIPILDVTILY